MVITVIIASSYRSYNPPIAPVFVKIIYYQYGMNNAGYPKKDSKYNI